MNKIDILQKMIDESNNIVFFGGAGVSTESGIKDFRSIDGLYNLNYKFPPEKILSHSFFMSNTEDFFEFYRDKLNCLQVEPNICHKYLFKLEKKGKLKAIVTQNIDGLHEKAGNRCIYNLHGSIYHNHCLSCSKEFGPEKFFFTEGIPYCDCGGILKPDVVLYEEALDDEITTSAIMAIRKCDLLIVAGSSLTVFPASSFIRYFKGNNMVIINNERTNYDSLANLIINDKIGNVFSKLK